MGLLNALSITARVAEGFPTRSTAPKLASPWAAGSSLTRVYASDLLGLDSPVATRAEAMRVPAIVKGRALIAGTLSRYPLQKYRGAARVASDTWMYRGGYQSPEQRMLWTLDDLIFHGASLWAVQRGAKDQVLDAIRVLPDEWEVDEDYRIQVRGQVVSAEQVCLIEGPQDGLLVIGVEAIRASLSMGKAWSKRVKSPVPLVELHLTDDTLQLDDDEVDEMVAKWERAREEGGTAVTPSVVETKVHGETPTDLFVSGRNAARIDIANFLNLPAALLDGTTAQASLTYVTQEGKRNELVDYSLSYWSAPVEARLSQDDMVPAGSRVEFDISWLSTHVQPVDGPVKAD